MYEAMYKKTLIGARGGVQMAIQASKNSACKKYLTDNWLPMSKVKNWALAARSHSKILLQTTSTNALESYHSLLKKRNGSPPATLFEATEKVLYVNKERIKAVEMSSTQATFKTYKSLLYLNLI